MILRWSANLLFPQCFECPLLPSKSSTGVLAKQFDLIILFVDLLSLVFLLQTMVQKTYNFYLMDGHSFHQ